MAIIQAYHKDRKPQTTDWLAVATPGLRSLNEAADLALCQVWWEASIVAKSYKMCTRQRARRQGADKWNVTPCTPWHPQKLPMAETPTMAEVETFLKTQFTVFYHMNLLQNLIWTGLSFFSVKIQKWLCFLDIKSMWIELPFFFWGLYYLLKAGFCLFHCLSQYVALAVLKLSV